MTASALASLLAPCSETDFLHRFYGVAHRHIPGRPEKFAELLSWSALNRIIDDHPLDWCHSESDGSVTRNRLSLILRGEPIAPARFMRKVRSPRGNLITRLDPTRLHELLRSGASLTVDGVDELHEPIRALADGLEWTLHEPTRASIYASWRGTPALERHWDTHDIFIAQISGRKHWRIHAPIHLHPVAADDVPAAQPDEQPAWEGTLGPGDLLYLPRGWWHLASALDGPSLHLTIGIYKRTGLHLLEALRTELHDSEPFRRDLPRFASPAERAAHLRALREELLARWDDDLLERFLESADAAALPRRPVVSLPWNATPAVLPTDRAATVRLTATRAPAIDSNDDGSVELRSLGRRRRLTAAELAALRPLLDGQIRRLGELVDRGGATLGVQDVRDLLADLVREGIVTVVDGGTEPDVTLEAGPE